MTIETASYINQLNTAYPRSTDLLKEGDDHIRMIKNSLKQTFPGITGPVALTTAKFNLLNDNISGTTSLTLTKGFTVSGGQAVNMGNNRVQGVAAPQATNDSVNLGYILKDLLNKIYPIGAVYFSHEGPEPAAIFGGTWARIAGGRFLMIAGNNNNEWNVGAGWTGGSTSFTIAEANLPAHGHVVPEHGHSAWSGGAGGHSHSFRGATGIGAGSGLVLGNKEVDQGAGTAIFNVGDHTHPISVGNQGAFWTNNTGSNAAISYIPAGVALNAWRRTGLA